MIVHVLAERRDHLDGTRTVFLDGKGIFDGNRLSAVSTSPDGQSKEICEFFEDHVRLVHKGETESNLRLVSGGEGSAEVFSSFGTMRFSAWLDCYVRSGEKISVRYRLLQGEQVIADNELRFEIGSKKAIPEGHA